MNARAARFWLEQPLLRGLSRRAAASRQSAPALRSFFTSTQPAAKARPSHRSIEQTTSLLSHSQQAPLFRRFRPLRFNSNRTSPSQNPNPTPHLGSPEPAPSLSQRLKKLSREYGWSAVGVYMALSVLDFPFCFLAVRTLGTERIGHYEHVVVEAFWNVVRIAFPSAGLKTAVESATAPEDVAEATAREGNLGLGSEVDKAEAKANGADASIWTQLALAYVVHKSFIFIRIPLTAAVLPKVVKTLRGWGWNIGKRTPKSK